MRVCTTTHYGSTNRRGKKERKRTHHPTMDHMLKNGGNNHVLLKGKQV